MKVAKGTKINSVKGEVGDVVEDFEGRKYLVTKVIPIGGFTHLNYRGIDLQGGNNNVMLYDMYLVANYGSVRGLINA